MAGVLRSVDPGDQRNLRIALGMYPTGVVVVCTTDAEGRPQGFTISSFSSLSLDPPLVMFGLKSTSPTLPHLRASKAFTVNILDSSQADLSTRFATAQPDKFADIRWHRGSIRQPRIPDVLAVLECSLWKEYPGGDHAILIGEVVAVDFDPTKRPLIHHQGRYGSVQPGAGGSDTASGARA